MGFRGVYNQLAENYDLRQSNPATKMLRKTESELLKRFAFGKTIDLGCGSGEHMSKGVFGLDISEGLLKMARKKSDLVIQGDLEGLPIRPGSFNSILCFYGTLNLVDLERSAGEISRIVKTGGMALLSVISPMDIDKHRSSREAKVKRFRIEGRPINMKLFEKEEIIEAFMGNSFKLKYFSSMFRLQKPRWGNFKGFSLLERFKIRVEFLFPKKLGRVYFFAFEKQPFVEGF